MFLQMIPMNLLKQLTRITDFVNQFIKNVTNLGKKNIYIGLKLDVRQLLKRIVENHGNGLKKNAKINNQFFHGLTSY